MRALLRAALGCWLIAALLFFGGVKTSGVGILLGLAAGFALIALAIGRSLFSLGRRRH